jgi:hypothetical protein
VRGRVRLSVGVTSIDLGRAGGAEFDVLAGDRAGRCALVADKVDASLGFVDGDVAAETIACQRVPLVEGSGQDGSGGSEEGEKSGSLGEDHFDSGVMVSVVILVV